MGRFFTYQKQIKYINLILVTNLIIFSSMGYLIFMLVLAVTEVYLTKMILKFRHRKFVFRKKILLSILLFLNSLVLLLLLIPIIFFGLICEGRCMC